MALEEVMQEEAAVDPARLTKEEELDLTIAVRLGERLLEDGGFDVIEKAIASSSDPSQVIGQFIMQMMVQMKEQLPAEIELSPRIYLSEGGVVEQLMDFLADELGVSRKILDRAEIYIASTSEQMAQAGAQQRQQGAQTPAAPAMPQAAPQQGGY